uniref:Cell division cycle protein 26 homolog n=1 Tax=Eptatretus burgeri TaxID=7764 RepID=A0A8C4N9X4_EPTBU
MLRRRPTRLDFRLDDLAEYEAARDPSAPELSGVTTYKFRVIGGANSTAPSSGRARCRYPAPQQYLNSDESIEQILVSRSGSSPKSNQFVLVTHPTCPLNLCTTF